METNTSVKVSNDFVPSSDNEIGSWAGVLEENISIAGAALGLSATVITESEDAARNLQNGLKRVNVKRSELAEAVEDKERIKAESLLIIRNLAGSIKRMPTYTTAIGGQLGLVANSQAVDVDNLHPELKVTAFPGYVKIAYNKKRMLGVHIYSRVQGSTQWDRIAQSRTSPYKDTRPLKEVNKPEIREYAAICYNGDNEIGQMSPIISITFGTDDKFTTA